MTEASVRVRLPTKFPATVTATSPIVLTQTGGLYNFSFDASALTVSIVEAIEFIIDGTGSVITTGIKGYLEIPFSCTITRATMLADQSGSIVVDVFKCTYSQFDVSTHPTPDDKITASAPPTITTSTHARDVNLTGWTKLISAGDVLGFNVNSVTSIQRVTLSLTVERA